MSKYISLEEAIAASEKFPLFGKTGVFVPVEELKALPGAPVLTPDEAENIANLVEMNFYRFAKELYEIDELDNLGWAESILSGWRKLERMAKDE